MESMNQPEASVFVSEDGLSVFVTCTVTEENLNELVDHLISQASSLRLAEPLDRSRLLNWFAREVSEHGPVLKKSVLLSGTAPTPPVDGQIEWAGKFFDHGFVVDEATGAIDYRRQAAQRSVVSGQLLATIKPPAPGTDGQDVLGRRIRVRPAKSANARAGENVTKDESDGTLHATTDGRVRWCDDVLSVDKVCAIEGCVGLETGNIDHPGAVEISQDVLQGATVAAKGDVEVCQVVEHANIQTGGNLTVRAGISGGPANKITAAGSIHARFILDANIEAGQDVVVEREIMHSSVKTQGSVQMPKGRLVGGETIALGGGVIGQTSSGAAVPTTFVAGEDFRLPEMLKAKEQALGKLTGELNELETRIKAVCGHAQRLSPPMMEKIKEAQNKGAQIKLQIEAINGEMEKIREASAENARFAIDVMGMIYPETIFRIGTERLRVQKETPGPVRVSLIGGRIQIIPLEK